VGINVFDLDGKVIYVNQIARKMVGVWPDDPLAGYCLFKDPEISEESKKLLLRGKVAYEERYIDFSAIRRHEMYATSKMDQDRTFIQLILSPYGDSGADPFGYIAVIVDMTYRKNIEDELRKEKHRIACILEGTNVGTWEWNVQTGETVANVWHSPGYHRA
jgi:PAS domain-containing protein